MKKDAFFEQTCMINFPLKYMTGFFGQGHNVGQWRTREELRKTLKVSLPPNIKSFHVHIDRDYDFKDKVYAERVNYEFLDVVLQYCKEHCPQVYKIITTKFK
jgi:hypothetical protein